MGNSLRKSSPTAILISTMKKSGGQGFTIVELLIVVVIIGILAAVILATFNGITKQSYNTRAKSELGSIAKAILVYQTINGRYPVDVSRGIPAEVTPYINGSTANWPNAPWPNSVYDYDNFTGSDGNEVSQISVRFCPQGGPLSACTFPNESWAAGFGVDSSAYWCVTGKCKAHPNRPDNYPGYCMNCIVP